jgi:O-antigen ligase
MLCVVILLFAKADAFIFKLVVLSSIPLTLSYLVTYKRDTFNRVPNPLMAPLAIFIVTLLPSLLNTFNPGASIYQMFNLISMIILFLILGNYVTEYRQMKACAIAYVFLSLCNGLNIIVQNLLTGNRVFGFAGIMYVDLVCVAIIICITAILFFRNWKSFLLLVIVLLLLVSLLFAQTRNTMISLAILCVFLFFFLLLYHRTFSIARKKVLLISAVSLLAIGASLGFLYYLVPQIFDRIIVIFSKKGGSGALVSSSLISRLLIWQAAFNAFLAHPIIGCGAYSFWTDSHYYSHIPNWLYKDWVQGMSEHETYFAVLTETGIIGFVGFITFLFSAIHLAFKSVVISVSAEQKYYSLGLLLLQIYVAVSMTMTDAWRWGQCGMLWGLILGFSCANYKSIMRSESTLEKQQ